MKVTSQSSRGIKGSSTLLALIVIIAGIASVGVYEYSHAVANGISDSAVQSIHTNAQIQASDISNLVIAKLESISTSLQVMSTLGELTGGNITAADGLLAAAQNSTQALTYDYTLDNSAGIPIASSNQSVIGAAQEAGINVSQRQFFIMARATGNTYFDASVVSVLSGDQYIVIAQPLYVQGPAGGQQARTFNGIVTAAISLTAIGSFLQSQIPPRFQSTFGLISSTGVILYSENQSDIGLSVFGAQIQSRLPASLKGAFDQMVNSSLEGNSGVEDFSLGGLSSALAYQPVLVSGAESDGSQGQQFGTVYVAAPDTLAASQAAQVSQLQTITSLTILAISGSAVAAAIVVLRRNLRLDRLVKARTADLEARTDELSQANRQLAARDEAQRDFINIAAHELRTPVQPLLGLTDLMQESMREAGAKGKVELSSLEVDMFARNTRRLEALTKNILDATRMDAGTLRLNREKFDLNTNLKDVISEVTNTPKDALLTDGSVRADTATGAQEVRFTPSAQPLYVDADKTRVFEVVSNLLRNALIFSNGNDVEISTSMQGSDALVRVRDRGAGIDPEIMPRLFTRFASKAPSGLGLGLYISKGIVEAHGGRIWAENNSDPEGGASLFFTLPLASSAGTKTGGDPGVPGKTGGANN